MKADGIGKIHRVGLREVWKHEALDFTTWLQNNIDVLSDAVGVDLVSAEREQAAGSFSVDIVAEDVDGNTVVIENQLEKSDHDHLGKVITYLVAMEAKSAIWIVSHPRPEHVAAVAWLNESTAASFYLLKMEAIKIGDSVPAPLLTLIVGPSDEGKELGKAKQEMHGRYALRKRFWTGLLDTAKKRTALHANISPSQYNWVGTSSGIRGVNYNYTVRKDETQVELYIDFGKDRVDDNEIFYNSLLSNKERIESEYGQMLDWQSLEGKRACRISSVIPNGGYRNEEIEWPSIYEPLIDAMIKFEMALAEHLQAAKKANNF